MSKENKFSGLKLLILVLLFLIPITLSTTEFKAYTNTFEIQTCACSTYENKIFLQNLDSAKQLVTYSVDEELNEETNIAGSFNEFYVYQEYIEKKSTLFPNYFILNTGETQLITNFVQIPCDASKEYELKTFLGTKTQQKVLTQIVKPFKCKSLEILKYNQTLNACGDELYTYKFKVENPAIFPEQYKVSVIIPEELEGLVSLSMESFILEKAGYADIFIYVKPMNKYGSYQFNVQVESVKNQVKNEFSFDLNIAPCYDFNLFYGEIMQYTNNTEHIEFFGHNKTKYSVCESEKMILPVKIQNTDEKALNLEMQLEPQNNFTSIWYAKLMNITKNTNSFNYINLDPRKNDVGLHEIELLIAPENSEIYQKYLFEIEVSKCNTPKISFPEQEIDYESENLILFNLTNNGVFASNYMINIDKGESVATVMILPAEVMMQESELDISNINQNQTIKDDEIIRLEPNEKKELVLYINEIQDSENLKLDIKVTSLDNGHQYSNVIDLGKEKSFFSSKNKLIFFLQMIVFILFVILILILLIQFVWRFFEKKRAEKEEDKLIEHDDDETLNKEKEERSEDIVARIFNEEERKIEAENQVIEEKKEEIVEKPKVHKSSTVKGVKQKRTRTMHKIREKKRKTNWEKILLIILAVFLIILFVGSLILLILPLNGDEQHQEVVNEENETNNENMILNESEEGIDSPDLGENFSEITQNETSQEVTVNESDITNVTLNNSDDTNDSQSDNFTGTKEAEEKNDTQDNSQAESNEKEGILTSFWNYVKNLFSGNPQTDDNNELVTNTTTVEDTAKTTETEDVQVQENNTEEIDWSDCDLTWESGKSIKINLSKAFTNEESNSLIYTVVNEPEYLRYEINNEIVTLTANETFRGKDSISFQADDMINTPGISPKIVLCVQEKEKENPIVNFFQATSNMIYDYRYNIIFGFLVLIVVILILNYTDKKKHSGKKKKSKNTAKVTGDLEEKETKPIKANANKKKAKKKAKTKKAKAKAESSNNNIKEKEEEKTF